MESNMTNTDYIIPLQDVALLEREPLEKNEGVEQKTDSAENKPQTDKPRRYSGAARRRYKKQRRALQSQNPLLNVTSATDSREISPPEAASAAGLKEISLLEAAPVTDPVEVSPQEATSATGFKEFSPPTEELKRAWSTSDEVANSSNGYSDKRRKMHVDQNLSVKTVNNTITMALILEGFPEKRLDANDVSIIRKNITRRILDLDNDIKAPTFTGMWNNNGAVFIHCVDEYSKDWLEKMSRELNIRGVSVHMLPAEDMVKRHRVVVRVTDPEISADEVLKLFDRQNEGLGAKGWIVSKNSERRDALRTHFIASISNSSVEVLKALNFKPYCGVVRATVKLLREENNSPVKQNVSRNEEATGTSESTNS
ncbi:uncharacterized protein [Linepithema humile]|uniref:uncharacterized protein n=1 Tax=Linepithema humile TaxID=83485 RepID=UPI00351E89BB